MSPSKLCIVLTVCALAITPSVRAELPSYTIVDVGTLDSYHGDARDVNDNGQVIGRSLSRSYKNHGFTWDEVNGMTDLGDLGTEACWPQGVNLAGQVVGKSLTAEGAWRAFLWDEENGIQPIGDPNARLTRASEINDVGQVAGYDGVEAFLWDVTTGVQRLGTLGGAASSGEGINNFGQVVGQSFTASGLMHAFLWDPGAGMQDLGTLGGSQSSAQAINNTGQVVGYSGNSWNIPRAFLWDAANGMQDLGVLQGGSSWAFDINEAGQAVGCGYLNGWPCAILWDPEQGVVDMNSLLPPDSGWTLSSARGINNRGDICGYGSLLGTRGIRAFLLRPEIEVLVPASLTYDGDLLLSTEGGPAALARLVACLRDDVGEILPIDDAEVVFGLTAEGIESLQVLSYSIGGVAECEASLEAGIYSVTASCAAYGIAASAVIEVYNPLGECLTGGGWILLDDESEKGKPHGGKKTKGHFGHNARYWDGQCLGWVKFWSSDRAVRVQSTSVDLLVVSGGNRAQFRGWATVNGVPGYGFSVTAADNGEGRKQCDTFELCLWEPGANPSAAPALVFGGELQGGNVQIHESLAHWRKRQCD